jgi:hypothetical protein
MILAVDVDYREDCARVAGILFRDWGDAHPATEQVVECNVVSDYRPGEFYRRELPCIRRLLQEIDQPVVVRLSLQLHLDALGISVGDVVSRCRDIVVSPYLLHHVRNH